MHAESGRRFGSLVVVTDAARARYVVVRCDCGTTKEVRIDGLAEARVVSCGCAKLSQSGLSRQRRGEYNAWICMRRRCADPAFDHYADYGGRGIRVCDRWTDFKMFLADMGPRPTAQHSLDRIDNGRGYEPENCRWATRTEQTRNSRANRVLTIDGVGQCVAAWSATSRIKSTTIFERLRRGWDAKRAVFTPVAAIILLTLSVVTSAQAEPSPDAEAFALASRMRAWRPTWRERHPGELATVADAIARACRANPWPTRERCADLLGSLTFKEASWRVGAIGRRGEIGLMQLLPGVATAGETRAAAADPAVNLRLGLAHLRRCSVLCRLADHDSVEAALSLYSGLRCRPSRGAALVLRWERELREVGR